jgi:hypothetical protein
MHCNMISETQIKITDQRIDDDHWDLLCTTCQTVRDFQVTRSVLKVLVALHSLGGEIGDMTVEWMRPAAEKKARIRRR